MYHLHVMGQCVTSLATAMGVIRNIPAQCTLAYEWTEDDDLAMITNYNGPLLEASPGVYELWVTKIHEPMLITDTGIMIGRTVLFTRETKAKLDGYLEENVRRVFHELLARSEKEVHVYQNPDGDRHYKFLWPKTGGPDILSDWPGYSWKGVADLDTGKING